MNTNFQQLSQPIKTFRLPRFNELPAMGLYLEQVTKYISDIFQPLLVVNITGSMISNYVKQGIVAAPVKKQYSRDLIAHLIYVAVIKNVISLENIKVMFDVKEGVYTNDIAYNYFCEEFENVLQYVYGIKNSLDKIGVEHSNEKIMLRNTIFTVAHKIYLDNCFLTIKKLKQ